MPWRPLPLSYAVAIYPFPPSQQPNELPLQIGDQLYVIEQGGKDDSWCRGYLVQPPSLLSALTPGGRAASDARVFSGIFPKCCIEIREQLGHDETPQPTSESSKPPAPVPMLKIGDESATLGAEPLVDEISSCLREWYASHLPDLILHQDYEKLDQMSEIVSRLEYDRRELLNDVLTAQERQAVQTEAVWDLVRGNKLLGAEVIVRDPEQQGRLVTAEDSAVDMSRLQSTMSVLDEPPVAKSEVTALHHCLVEVKSANGSDVDSATISLALYQKSFDGTVSQYSETYTSTIANHPKTLFSDLSAREIATDGQLFLVVKANIPEPPKVTRTVTPEPPASRNGTFRSHRESIMNRRKSNLPAMFSSKRKSEKLPPNGRATPQPSDTHSESTTEEKKPNGPPLPRVVGIGIYDIAALFRAEREEIKDLDLWAEAGEEAEEDAGCPDLLPQLLSQSKKRYCKCGKIRRLQLDLKPFKAPDADTLIRTNPMVLHMTPKTQKIGFSEAPSKRRSDIYLTLSKASVAFDSVLSHPEHGIIPLKNTNMANMQLTMELRDSSGGRLERCIQSASNGSSITALRTSAVEVGSPWDQTICIKLPVHKVSEAHLVLSVADAPNFPFALAWMPLWDKNAFVRDGKHSLILHAYDKSTSTFTDDGRGMYLKLPWDHDMLKKRAQSVGATQIAAIEVETRLVSTEFSQDRTLAGLLNWQALTSTSLREVLQKLVFVPEIEVVKQLYEVLDALFGVLEEKAGTPKMEDLIFNDIVFVLGIVHDRRYNLGPRIERYIEEHFVAPPVAHSLVRSFTRLLQSVADGQSARDMRALFKVGKQFMKLLMEAHSQNGGHEANAHTAYASKKQWTFKEDMQAVFFGLQMMMRSDLASLVGNKTLLIQNFHSWLPELLPVYSAEEVIKIAVDFVDACDEVTGRLALYKIILILNYARLDQVWAEPKDWQHLVKQCKRWLGEYLPADGAVTDTWREQVRLCCSVLAALLRRPIPMLLDFLPTIISTYCALATAPQVKRWTLSLLFQENYPFVTKNSNAPERFDEALLELSALVSELTKLKQPAHTKLSKKQQAEQILQTLDLVQSLLSENACPSSWLSLHIYHHASAVNILAYVSKQLETSFVPEPEDAESFDMEIWKAFFDALLSLVTSPALTLESFSEQKRRAVWKIAGDVRQAGADLLRSSWASLGWEATEDEQRRYNIERLGGFQVQYVPSLVGAIVELCLSMHEGLRRVGVHILQTMIISEWALSEDLSMIETEMIGALNTILKSQSDPTKLTGNEIVARKLFVGELMDSFSTIASQPDDALWTAVEELVGTTEELIDLLSTSPDDLVHEEQSEPPAPPQVNGTEGSSRSGVPDRSISRLEGRIFGSQALECYKQLAEEYERTGDFKRLAKTHRAMARIHETRAVSRLENVAESEVNGGAVDDEEDHQE